MRRRIFKGSGRSEREVLVVLQNLLVAECLFPADDLYLVSPWVSDISVVDNRAGGFDSVESLWPHRWLRLSEILCFIARTGTRVVVATRSDEHNRTFERRLRDVAADTGVTEGLKVVIDPDDEQHEKGLLGSGYFVNGSMNFTQRGVHLNDEILSITTDPDEVAQARLNFRSLYG